MARIGPRWISALSLSAAVLAVTAVSAQQPAGVTPATTAARNAGAARVSSTALRAGVPVSNTTTIMGFAWTRNDQPIPNAPVRLRSVITGRVQAAATANVRGEFVFWNIEGGTYVVELVDVAGRIQAVGAPFSISVGEIVATFVRLAGRTPLLAGLLGGGGNAAGAGGTAVTAAGNLLNAAGNAAATVVSSAASLGITAVAPTGTPVSPEG